MSSGTLSVFNDGLTFSLMVAAIFLYLLKYKL